LARDDNLDPHQLDDNLDLHQLFEIVF